MEDQRDSDERRGLCLNYIASSVARQGTEAAEWSVHMAVPVRVCVRLRCSRCCSLAATDETDCIHGLQYSHQHGASFAQVGDDNSGNWNRNQVMA